MIFVFTEVLQITSRYPDKLSQFTQDVASFSNCWDMCVDVGEIMLTEEPPSTRSKICPSASVSATDVTWAANNVLSHFKDLRKLKLISIVFAKNLVPTSHRKDFLSLRRTNHLELHIKYYLFIIKTVRTHKHTG